MVRKSNWKRRARAESESKHGSRDVVARALLLQQDLATNDEKME